LKFHAELADAISALPIDIVHTVGPRMKALHEALPAGKRGLYGERASDLSAALVDQVVAGDVVMIKGSNGSKMGSIVQALKERHAQNDQVEG
jgi:UDP-N-acetylmuramyl pentapeptide synthase